ncbi:MAG: flap structure-specific endonuclease, partial [Thermoplasmata archaeon]
GLEGIRAFFFEPPVDASSLPRPGRVDAERVKRFLCEERDFSESRVSQSLTRLRGPGPRARTLDEF